MTDKKSRIIPTDHEDDLELEPCVDKDDSDEEKALPSTDNKMESDIDHIRDLDPDNKAIYDLEEYIKWHRTHPRASTPRRARGNVENAILTGVARRCEDNPDFIYTLLPTRKTQLPRDFEPTKVGKNAEFNIVSQSAHDYEHSLRLDQREDFDDPWWNKSVKDQIYVHHLPDSDGADDGSLWDAPPVASVLEANMLEEMLNKAAREREEKRQQKLNEIAISKQFNKPPRVRVSAWDASREQNTYTSDGQEALDAFSKTAMELDIKAALEEFADPNRGGGFAKRGGGGMSHKARELHKTLARYKKEMGGEVAVEKMSEGFIQLAARHRNAIKATTRSNWTGFDLEVDFLDACVKVNPLKAIPMLMFGADANIETEDEEPVLVMMLNKVSVCRGKAAAVADGDCIVVLIIFFNDD